MPFIKGRSGNPAGRPLGARNKETLAIEARLEARAAEIVDVAIGRAVRGDTPALRMCLDRILPRVRDRPVPFALPPVIGAAAAERAVEDITAAVGTGELTIPEALGLLQIVEKSARIVAAARAAQQAGAGEAIAAREEAIDATRPARAGSDGSQQTTEETIKYNEPLAPANGAGRSGAHGGEQGTQITMKCNEPVAPANGMAEPEEQRTEQTPMTQSPLPTGEATERNTGFAVMEGTTKYNEPLAPTNDAAATPSCGKAGQKTTRYNGPPGLMDGVAHFTRPSAHPAPPAAPAPRAVRPRLSSAA